MRVGCVYPNQTVYSRIGKQFSRYHTNFIKLYFPDDPDDGLAHFAPTINSKYFQIDLLIHSGWSFQQS